MDVLWLQLFNMIKSLYAIPSLSIELHEGTLCISAYISLSAYSYYDLMEIPLAVHMAAKCGGCYLSSSQHLWWDSSYKIGCLHKISRNHVIICFYDR